jgi:histidyl-tRNA synthetase
VQTYLSAAGTDYTDDQTLVRGLDYYTSTVFELTSGRLGAQDAVAAGGRYDGLVKKYGGPDTPGFGFAIGIERALLASDDNQATPPSPYMYIAPLGGKAISSAINLAVQARSEGISAIIDYSGKPLKKQLAAAHKSRAKLAVIIGDEELANDEVIVRDMENSGQTNVTVDDFSEWIRAHNKRKGT